GRGFDSRRLHHSKPFLGSVQFGRSRRTRWSHLCHGRNPILCIYPENRGCVRSTYEFLTIEEAVQILAFLPVGNGLAESLVVWRAEKAPWRPHPTSGNTRRSKCFLVHLA